MVKIDTFWDLSPKRFRWGTAHAYVRPIFGKHFIIISSQKVRSNNEMTKNDRQEFWMEKWIFFTKRLFRNSPRKISEYASEMIVCPPPQIEAKSPPVSSVCWHIYASKVLLKILTKRLKAEADGCLGDDQFGFRKRRGTRDAIGVLRILAERSLENNQAITQPQFKPDPTTPQYSNQIHVHLALDRCIEGSTFRRTNTTSTKFFG